MNILDRIFCCLLILAAALHTLGAFNEYKPQSSLLMWALCAGFARFLLAAVNLLRTWRPNDKALAAICLGGCLVSVYLLFRLAGVIGSMRDYRVVVNLAITVALTFFSLRTLFAASRETAGSTSARLRAR